MVFNGTSLSVLHVVDLAVDVKIVIVRADFHVAGGQDQIGVVDRADDIHDAQLMRFELERIHIDHNLPVTSAKRHGHRRAGHVGDLVANVKLAEVAQLGFGQAFTLQGNQTHRQAGGVELQNHRRQGAGRKASKSAIARLAMLVTAESALKPG